MEPDIVREMEPDEPVRCAPTDGDKDGESVDWAPIKEAIQAQAEARAAPKFYVCGPISGYGDLKENLAMFTHVGEILRRSGFEVYVPPEDENIISERMSWAECLKKDIPHVVGADHILLLPNWERSRGARLEYRLATELGIPVSVAMFHDGDFVGSRNPHPGELEQLLNAASEVEERIVNPETGGMKGQKLPQLGWAPPGSLMELAKVYGMGAKKYSPTNYRAGYNWSLSVNAMWRHFLAWEAGESIDPETGGHHLAMAAWHCLTLIYFEGKYPELDDVRWEA